MNHLRSFNESKDKSYDLDKSGVLIAKNTFTINYKWDGDRCTCDIEENEFIKYQINNDDDIFPYIRLDIGGVDGYDIPVSTFNKFKNRFDKVDTSKPYKLEYEDFIEYFNTKHQLHREDGPAIEYKDDGSQYWYVNGKLHREDGPASIDTDGEKQWYLNGKNIKEQDFNSLTKKKDNISKENLEDILIDLIDEFDNHEIKQDNKLNRWHANFENGSPKNIYLQLSGISDKLSDFGYEVFTKYDGKNLKLVIQ
jgi:hypothetical protein